jgi:hypothetical protein
MFAFVVKGSEHKYVKLNHRLGPYADKLSFQVFYFDEILQYQVLCFLTLCKCTYIKQFIYHLCCISNAEFKSADFFHMCVTNVY